jgi:acyl-CoA synthetase (AMP-forming)/AMP-acid ligase II
VAVVVQPKQGGEPPSLEAIQGHCRSLIAGYKIPRRLLIVDAIPLTAAGKPDSKGARALF